MSKQDIKDNSDLKRWRTELPNLYDDSGLDPYEFRLLAHYKRVGTTTESTATTAQKCNMSTGKVSSTRQRLAEKGFITLETRPCPNGISYEIEVIDIWEKNFEHYSSRKKPSPHEGKPSPHEGKPSPHEGKPSPHETKKEHIKNKPSKKEHLPAADADGGNLYKLAVEIANVCGMDFQANKGRLFREARLLEKATPSPTPELIRESFSGGDCFWTQDWRGAKGQRPTPAVIREVWGQLQSYSPPAEYQQMSRYDGYINAQD